MLENQEAAIWIREISRYLMKGARFGKVEPANKFNQHHLQVRIRSKYGLLTGRQFKCTPREMKVNKCLEKRSVN